MFAVDLRGTTDVMPKNVGILKDCSHCVAVDGNRTVRVIDIDSLTTTLHGPAICDGDFLVLIASDGVGFIDVAFYGVK